MITNVDFWSQNKAESHHFTSDDLVISISDSLPIDLQTPSDLLRVHFLDNQGSFNKQHGIEILNFVTTKHKEEKAYNLIIHCHAGVSRSAAVALFCQVITGCSFPNKGKAGFANTSIVKVLSDLSQIYIDIPEPQITQSGIYLF